MAEESVEQTVERRLTRVEERSEQCHQALFENGISKRTRDIEAKLDTIIAIDVEREKRRIEDAAAEREEREKERENAQLSWDRRDRRINRWIAGAAAITGVLMLLTAVITMVSSSHSSQTSRSVPAEVQPSSKEAVGIQRSAHE